MFLLVRVRVRVRSRVACLYGRDCSTDRGAEVHETTTALTVPHCALDKSYGMVGNSAGTGLPEDPHVRAMRRWNSCIDSYTLMAKWPRRIQLR